MTKLNLKAESRTATGRKVRRLRKEGIVPANVFGKAMDSLTIQINQKEFEKVYKEAGETGIISLDLAGKDHPVLVSDVQVHPVSSQPLHIDFRQVNLKEKIEANVPVELTGESPAEKEGNLVVLMTDEVTVEALPADLPEKFVVDISTLTEVDQAIYVKDLEVDSAKVEIKTDLEIIVAKVEAPQKEVIIEEPVVAEGETAPVEGAAAPDEKKEDASETPAE